MGSSSSLITALLNALFIISVALGLSKEDVKTIVLFAVGYSLIGLCLSYTIPNSLHSRGVMTKEEKKLYSNLLLVSWVITVWFLLPKFKE